MKPRGWTESEANQRAYLNQMRESDARSQFSTSMAFDLLWNEWVIVTNHPTAPITMNRKPRGGLRRDQTWRILKR